MVGENILQKKEGPLAGILSWRIKFISCKLGPNIFLNKIRLKFRKFGYTADMQSCNSDVYTIITLVRVLGAGLRVLISWPCYGVICVPSKSSFFPCVSPIIYIIITAPIITTSCLTDWSKIKTKNFKNKKFLKIMMVIKI